jgi:vacuolar-type H+-ATPase subunit H
LLNQKERMLAQAQEEANRTLALAREKANEMVQKDSISQESQRRADQILNQARADAEATRRDADEYVIESLAHIQNELETLLTKVRNGIRVMEDERMRQAVPPSDAPPQV